MAAIPISEAPQRAIDRLEEVLQSSLFTSVLDARSSTDYPLPHPDTWVQVRVNLARHWQALNVNSALGVIHPGGPAQVVNDYSGSVGTYSRTQRTPYDIGIILRAPDAFPTVQRYGRTLLDDEWLQRRVELYRGALLDVIPRYAPEKESIHEVYLESGDANLFEIPEIGRFAHATVTISIFQNVLINTWS